MNKPIFDDAQDVLKDDLELAVLSTESSIESRSADIFPSGGFVLETDGKVTMASPTTVNVASGTFYDERGKRVTFTSQVLTVTLAITNYIVAAIQSTLSTPVQNPIEGNTFDSVSTDSIEFAVLPSFTPGQTDINGNPYVLLAIVFTNGVTITSITDEREFLLGNQLLFWGGAATGTIVLGTIAAYDITIANYPVMYRLGSQINFVITGATNNSNPTININGIGVIPITDAKGTPLVADTLVVNEEYIGSFDGAVFRILNLPGNIVYFWGGTTSNTGSGLHFALIIPDFELVYKTGFQVNFIVDSTNQANADIDINTLGVIPLVDALGNVLPANTLINGEVYSGIYDGTSLRVVNLSDRTTYWGGTDFGVADNYSITIPEFPPTIKAGTIVMFIVGAGNANTGASVISINGGPLVSVSDALANPLNPNTLLAGEVILLIYDGVGFRTTTVPLAPWGTNKAIFGGPASNGAFSWSVPAGVSFIKIQAWGGGGGTGSGGYGAGGGGGYAEAIFSVAGVTSVSGVVGNEGSTTSVLNNIASFSMSATGGSSTTGSNPGSAGGGTGSVSGQIGDALKVTGGGAITGNGTNFGGGSFGTSATFGRQDEIAGQIGNWPGGGATSSNSGGNFGSNGCVLITW